MKKLAAAAVSALMAAVSVCSVFAAQGDPQAPAVDTTKKGSVKLTKYDSAKAERDPETGEVARKTGVSADDVITVAGAEFQAYQVLSFDGTNYTVTSDFENVVTVNDLFNPSADNGSFITYGTTSDVEAQISKLQSKAKTLAGKKAVTDANGIAKFEDLDLGVYLIAETKEPDNTVISTQAFLVTVPEYVNGAWVYDVEAFPKDQSIQLDKTFTERDDNTKQTKSDSFAIGDTIPYTVTAVVPDYGMSSDYPETALMTDNMAANGENGVNKFNALDLRFVDTLSKGLTLDMSSVKVYLNDTELTGGTQKADDKLLTLKTAVMNENKTVALTPEGEYNYSAIKTEGENGATVLTVTIPWYVLDKDYQGSSIKLTYNAQLNADALVGDPNPNTVKYYFKHDPRQESGDPEDPPSSTTETYTYTMEVIKSLAGKVEQNSDKYASVKFTLKNGNDLCSFYQDTAGWVLWTGSQAPEGKTLVKEAAPDKNGNLTVKGLAAGKYTLTETATAQGYLLVAQPLEITVSEVKENGKVVGKVTAVVKASDGSDKELGGDNAHGVFRIEIDNPKSQFHLPTTGDIGFWFFTIGGGVLMAAAIVFISVLRKKSK